MSHSYTTADGTVFIHNPDMSGGVDIVRGGERMTIQGSALVEFMRKRDSADGDLESNIAILRLGIERDERRLAGARDALHHYLCELDGEPCNCVECRATDKPRPE